MASNAEVWYNGSDAPAAQIRFTSLEMPVSQHKDYSAAFAQLFTEELAIPSERVWVEFHSPTPAHLGKAGTTIEELRKLN